MTATHSYTPTGIDSRRGRFHSVQMFCSTIEESIPFNISCKDSLVVMYFFSFCLSGKLFISPSILCLLCCQEGSLSQQVCGGDLGLRPQEAAIFCDHSLRGSEIQPAAFTRCTRTPTLSPEKFSLHAGTGREVHIKGQSGAPGALGGACTFQPILGFFGDLCRVLIDFPGSKESFMSH